MSKLFWVALPLLLAAAWVALLALRRRLPSRMALNVGSSLLLLAYLTGTAGLGIFWVANQQLPVFDWHYLFGYGTVLLACLHLAFNFPMVWRWLTRRSRSSERGGRAAGAVAIDRRGVLGTFGAIGAAVAAFALGMRHGRSELRIDAAAVGGGNAGSSVVEQFHALSSHTRGGVLLRAPSASWGDPPPPFKVYSGVPRIALPSPRLPPTGRPDARAIGIALWHTLGITERRGGLELRASPSSGALFSTELYLAVRVLAGVEPGLWHYDSQAHALERIGGATEVNALLAAAPQAASSDLAAAVVATAVFGRTGQKYGDRTYRYVLADLGHALENLRVAALAAGFAPAFVAAFDEARIARAIGVDENNEGVLALLAMAAVDPSRAPAPAGWRRPVAGDLVSGIAPPSRWQPAPITAGALPLGITAAVHAATSLRALEPVREQARPGEAPPVPLPAVALQSADWLPVIASRRSHRRFSAAPLRLEDLAAVLARINAGELLLSPALRIDVVVHAVAGLAPGAYRCDVTRHALLLRRVPAELRTAARAAALDQDVIGDAAAVFVLSADRAALAADPLGAARGYRHALLEAGLLGERIYLEAGLRGLGACAVGAFYDGEAAELVALDPQREWVLHFAALGVLPEGLGSASGDVADR